MNTDDQITQVVGPDLTKSLENKNFSKRFIAEMESSLTSRPVTGTTGYTTSRGAHPPSEALLKWSCGDEEWMWVTPSNSTLGSPRLDSRSSLDSPIFVTAFEAFCFVHLTRILEVRKEISAPTITESSSQPPKYEYTFLVNGKHVTKINPSFLELYSIANSIMRLDS
jgi:hypothetical protein